VLYDGGLETREKENVRKINPFLRGAMVVGGSIFPRITP